MPTVRAKYDQKWVLRMLFLEAIFEVAPRVVDDFLNGPYKILVEAFQLAPHPDIQDLNPRRWDEWPPKIWRKLAKRYPQVAEAIKAIDDWAERYHLEVPWLKGYFLRLAFYWHTVPGTKQNRELLRIINVDSALGDSLPPLPDSLPLWFPGGVWIHDPLEYAQGMLKIRNQNGQAEKSQELVLPAPQPRYVGTLAEYLKAIKAWATLTEKHMLDLGWSTMREKRQLDHFKWLVLRVCGRVGSGQIQDYMEKFKSIDFIQETTVILADQIELGLPKPRKVALSALYNRLGYKK